MIVYRYILTSILSIIFINSAEVSSQLQTIDIDLEIVTTNALAGGDGGNQWGGHQCRIIKNTYGIFTVYTSGGIDHLSRKWHLMQRMDNGWRELAADKSGREPVNVMTGSDGTIYIVGWPEYKGTIWSGVPQESEINLRKEKLIAVYTGSHPYNAAGIDNAGNICVITSVDDSDGGRFQWAYYNANTKTWRGRITFLNYRHCYTYIFPHPDHSISIVSTRDVRWQSLGYDQPPNTFDYVFNAFRYWTVNDFSQPLQEMIFVEESPTEKYPFVVCRAMNDVYVDHKGNMHILHSRQGESTQGQFLRFHSVYSGKGKLLYTDRLSTQKGRYCRIFQDELLRYFILDDTGILYMLDDRGTNAIDSVQINLKRFPVNYAGFGLTVPRTGSKLSNQMDIVYPSRKGKYYIYFRLHLNTLFTP